MAPNTLPIEAIKASKTANTPLKISLMIIAPGSISFMKSFQATVNPVRMVFPMLDREVSICFIPRSILPPKILSNAIRRRENEGPNAFMVFPIPSNRAENPLPNPANASLTTGILSPNKIRNSAIINQPDNENSTRRIIFSTVKKPRATVHKPLKVENITRTTSKSLKILATENPRNTPRITLLASRAAPTTPANRPVPRSLVRKEDWSVGALPRLAAIFLLITAVFLRSFSAAIASSLAARSINFLRCLFCFSSIRIFSSGEEGTACWVRNFSSSLSRSLRLDSRTFSRASRALICCLRSLSSSLLRLAIGTRSR